MYYFNVSRIIKCVEVKTYRLKTISCRRNKHYARNCMHCSVKKVTDKSFIYLVKCRQEIKALLDYIEENNSLSRTFSSFLTPSRTFLLLGDSKK